MKAEDSVMRDNQLRTHCYWALKGHEITERGIDTVRLIAKAQAEVSFKAGHEELRQNLNEFLESKWCVSGVGDTKEDAKRFINALVQVGIKEVVDWVNKRGFLSHKFEGHYQSRAVHLGSWQTQLKEWGIHE